MTNVIEQFVETAEAHPDRPAVHHSGRTTTYAALAGWVRTVAARLGPRPGMVGLLAGHSADTVAGVLGIWAAGGAYCPIDPAYPPRRQQAMLAAAGCRVVLVPAATAAPAARKGIELLELPRPAADAEAAAVPAAPEGPAAPEEPAYCLFTSGSTGEPKPVITSHRAIATVVRSLRGLFGIDPADRVLQFASLNWDTCFEEMLPTLTGGASLVIDDEAFTGSFPRFLRLVEAEAVSVLNLPTAFWHELVTHLRQEGGTLPRRVRLLIIGGEPVSPARLADWAALDVGHVRLLNTYGCTETTLITHAVDLHGPLAARVPASRVPIGRALPHVVERVGDDGELLVGGPALASGYRGLEAANRTRFVILGSQRFFRTGDRVGRRPDGMLVPDGRLDHELKIRGIRVDPAEVEAQLALHPAVRAVAVTGVTVADHVGLAAYVVARPNGASSALATDLREFLRARVPAHLVPSRISIVSDLAYTASGKVDRRRTAEVDSVRGGMRLRGRKHNEEGPERGRR